MLYSICQQTWKTQPWPQDCKRSVFIPIPKKGNAKEYSNCHTIVLISHAKQSNAQNSPSQASAVHELPVHENFQMFKLGLEKAEEPEIKLSTSIGSWKKTREFQKNICFCFIDYTKAFDCVDHNKQWKILQEMGILDQLACLLRNRYAGQEVKLELDMEQRTGSK